MIHKWNETIRDLIKHENELVADRLGWMGTLQGLLFTALAFSWEKGEGLLSPATVLCVIGIFIALLSLEALLQSSSAIDGLLTEWDEHTTNKILIGGSDPPSRLPPVWALSAVHNRQQGGLWWLKWKQGWFKAPWHWIPVCLLIGWGFLLWFHLTSLEPLKGPDQSLVHDELKRALVHNKFDKEAQQAITGLALIHGNASAGGQVFSASCAKCHDTPSSQGEDQTIPSRDRLIEYDRKGIVSGILYPNPNKVTREGKRHMTDGLATVMSPVEFVDVVEYLTKQNENR